MTKEVTQSIFDRFRVMLERDKSIRLVANDPALTAELLLLFRVILADGEVKEQELDMLQNICTNEFGISADALDGVYTYLHDFSFETTSEQSANMFSSLDVERRQKLLDHMIAIAESDNSLAKNEVRLLDRTAALLGFDLKAAAQE